MRNHARGYAGDAMESWLAPLHDARSMRAADAWAIEDRGVPSLELMEAAGTAVAEAVREVAHTGPVRAVCGKGNNGGDGLVAARRLAETGFDVDVILLWPASALSADAAANLERLPGEPREIGPAEVRDALAGSGAVVDAIFGTGFEGMPRSPADAAIEAVNACGAPVVSADVPSGMNASSGEVEGLAVEAAVTVSFHAPKLGHWIAPGKWHAGDVRVADIGIPPDVPVEAPGGLISTEVLALAPPRDARSTKFSSGQVLVAGGSRGLTGAVCLAAQSAIRSGAGYATVAVPADLEPIFEAKLTEVMSLGCPGPGGCLGAESEERIVEAAARARCVVLGPGLGRADDSAELARALTGRLEAPLLVDADGLNALGGRLDLLRERPAPTVLTPHAGELGRLLERESSEVSERRLASAREAAEQSGAIVVLKGDDTLVVEPSPGGRVAVNGLGSPGLATAGTGDVLSGTIGAFLARGTEPFAAACAGVHAHARAGRLAAERTGSPESVIAGDVIAALPAALVSYREGG
jgi:ADP-dependent NAD(P)H-hydrate dehydratase / NAD(P)H-hydrate epimerase